MCTEFFLDSKTTANNKLGTYSSAVFTKGVTWIENSWAESLENIHENCFFLPAAFLPFTVFGLKEGKSKNSDFATEGAIWNPILQQLYEQPWQVADKFRNKVLNNSRFNYKSFSCSLFVFIMCDEKFECDGFKLHPTMNGFVKHHGILHSRHGEIVKAGNAQSI
jgi:hypothetical protein